MVAPALLLLATLSVFLWEYVHCNNILVFPAAGCFNLPDLIKISSRLASRGHNITVLLPDVCVIDANAYLDMLASRADLALLTSPAPSVDSGDDCALEEPAKTDLKLLPRPHLIPYDSMEMDEFISIFEQPSMAETLTRRLDFSLSNCEAILTNASLIAQLGMTGFSLALGDSSDFCFAPLSDALALSRVDYDALGSHTTPYLTYGLSYPLGYVPAQGSRIPGGAMTFAERARNVWHHWQLRSARSVVLSRLRSFRRKHRARHPGLLPRQPTSSSSSSNTNKQFTERSRPSKSNKAPGSSKAARSSKGGADSQADIEPMPAIVTIPSPLLCIAALDWALLEPHPVAPFIKYVGAIQPEPARPLPDALEEFVSGGESSRGVILVSFSQGYRLPQKALVALAEALAELHMRVVWHLSDARQEDLRRLYPPILHTQNIMMMSDAVPRNDLIGHPKVLVVMTDGSIHSILEAMYHAKPVYAVPLSLEQEDVVARMARLGVGKRFDRKFLERGFAYLIELNLQRISVSNSFHQRALIFSRRLRAHRPSPTEQAANWVEYALDSASDGDSQFLMPLEVLLPWWKCNCADVYLAAVALLLAVVGVVWKVMSMLLRCGHRRPSRRMKME